MSQMTSPTAVPTNPAAPTGPVAASAPPSSGGLSFFSGGGTTQAPATTSNSPLISPDQSSLSQYVISQVGGYPVTVGGFSGLPSQSTTIGQALNDFYELPQSQLVQLETMLWDGGFYVNGDGSPMTAAPAFGSYDSQSWTAFARALERASSTGKPVMQVIQDNISSGAGAAAHTAMPSPELGGGAVYSINLTNPADVALKTNQIFQAALGRNATKAEMDSVTSSLQAQEKQQGFASVAGHESQNQAQYQAQITQRNTQYSWATTPKLALGPVPNGPYQTNSAWAASLLGYMGLPVTAQSVAFMSALASQLGKGVNDPGMNPLGVVMPQGGSSANKEGNQDFQSWAQSMQSTAEVLLSGRYQGLVDALRTGQPQQSDALSQSLSVLSGGKVKSVIPTPEQAQEAANASVSYQPPPTTSPSTGIPSGPDPGRMTAAVMGGPGAIPSGGPALTSDAGTSTGGVTTPTGSTAPVDLQTSQAPPNPGDQYLAPVTTITTDPASVEGQAYQEATTGANRPAYLGNQYLNAYQAILSMIKNGGPTG